MHSEYVKYCPVQVQQEVLALVSSEGVDTVLLRAELLIEAGLDKPAPSSCLTW